MKKQHLRVGIALSLALGFGSTALTAQAPTPDPAPKTHNLTTARSIFSRIDADKSGAISLAETRGLGIALSEFRIFDGDGDGLIARGEFLIGYRTYVANSGQGIGADLEAETTRLLAQRRVNQAQTQRSEGPAEARSSAASGVNQRPLPAAGTPATSTPARLRAIGTSAGQSASVGDAVRAEQDSPTLRSRVLSAAQNDAELAQRLRNMAASKEESRPATPPQRSGGSLNTGALLRPGSGPSIGRVGTQQLRQPRNRQQLTPRRVVAPQRLGEGGARPGASGQRVRPQTTAPAGARGAVPRFQPQQRAVPNSAPRSSGGRSDDGRG